MARYLRTLLKGLAVPSAFRGFFLGSLAVSIYCGMAPAYAQTHQVVMQLAQACHPSYEGECVPITSDADCASGSGNGPAYVYGPVRVVGPDDYGLDRDGDGIACEK
jgi:hypothetical protein